jgi:hypothetical protein
MTEVKEARGLSYSSYSEYTACPRKYFYRKVAKFPIDSDASEDTEAFMIGKTFHKCLEDTKHDLTGYTFQQCVSVGAEFGVEDEDTLLMIFAMLSKYKLVHEKTKLKLVACEATVGTPTFYGVIDAVMYDENKEGFWIVDLKTAGSWSENTLITASSHTQLNIYSRYADEVAAAVGLKDRVFLGCRLRVTTKSRLVKKKTESSSEYLARMSAGIRSLDIVIPRETMPVDRISKMHEEAADTILKATVADESKFSCNFGNCFMYYKPCNYYSRCHGVNYTESPTLEMIEAD